MENLEREGEEEERRNLQKEALNKQRLKEAEQKLDEPIGECIYDTNWQ